MNAQELYQQAYTLHYKKKDAQNALNQYLHIIAQYPSTNEAKYARQQINNIQLDKIDISLLDPECRNVLAEKIQLDEQTKQAAQQIRDAENDKIRKQQQKDDIISKVRSHIIPIQVVSTPSLDGYKIKKYLDFVSGESVIPAGIAGSLTTGTFLL